jgi:hypothetical protein
MWCCGNTGVKSLMLLSHSSDITNSFLGRFMNSVRAVTTVCESLSWFSSATIVYIRRFDSNPKYGNGYTVMFIFCVLYDRCSVLS